jgi:8-hydroxy-5-deazaflavin:NADPH oxidoreductase
MALGRRFVADNDLLVGSRDPSRGERVAAELGAVASGSYREVVDASEVVILAVPWWGITDTLAQMGEAGGKVVVDTVNPFTDDSYTVMVEFKGTSAAEQIQDALPAAHVVKGWNTVHAQVIDSSPDFNGVAVNVFLCGDSPPAKATVAALASGIGYAPVDCGPLTSARYLEPMSGLKVRLSYDLDMGTEQALNLIERNPDSHAR